MKLTIESTDRIVEIQNPTRICNARAWRGKTENGIDCVLYVVRVRVLDGQEAEFARELKETPETTEIYGEADAALPRRVLV